MGNVLVISAEDADDDTIKPRLIAAGADESRIHSMTAIKQGEEERPITFPDDLATIEPGGQAPFSATQNHFAAERRKSA